MLPSSISLLAIESSCDDTAAAVLKGGSVVSSVVASQRIHEGFGGVVPELASRAHQRLIVPTVEAALEEAGINKTDLDAVAVTYGPGLAGSLLVGLSFAKALALGLDIPLIGVNHLEGHIYSVFIDEPRPSFPYLCLTVSGGHTLLTLVKEGFVHEELGRTRDDAAGEAFDKVAKILGLGYPGGPAIDRLAKGGDAAFKDFPSPRLPNENHRKNYTFSFSGIKTNVLYYLRDLGDEHRQQMLETHLPDIAASFQETVVDALVGAIRDAVEETGVRHVAVVGGVSANSRLRERAQLAAEEDGFELYVPALKYAVDNAAMIAVTAAFKLDAGHTTDLDLTVEPALKV
ncbi:MAG: tRNA (adenosine(37)-N6)-threonylcarbamoyltransferase complex transferase subunit TsaD [Rubricoccaceae bacterium]|nr:tRNA (adenosine(37)-N6)-threonylcarbamoyltransferase complex transferase subunit TsaD [Rubricoccaceae bacterium]